ncbi:MAG: histidine kinase, partial [Oscillospiraceae bacterium]|nr:histidine kinase [Oscillospiraceae bacterium]
VASDKGLTVIGPDGPRSRVPLSKVRTASGEELEYDDLIEMLDGIRIRSVIRDSKDRLWISTWRAYGLLRYDHGELTVFNVDDGLCSSQVRAVYETSSSRILVACTGGVNVIEGDRVVDS